MEITEPFYPGNQATGGKKEMIKPFKGKNPNLEKFFIPRSVQQSIPIKKVHKDGAFEVAGLYSKTWRFFDVNYAVARP